jgi:hypothetical protein
MRDSWGMNDIYFIKSNKSNSAPLGEAYVSRTFTTTSNTQSLSKGRSRSYVKNEMVFALGVALLELSYGQHILKMKTEDDPPPQGNDASITEYSIANRLIEEIADRELSSFGDAVIRCVRLNFDTNATSLEDSDFRQMFYQGVVLPLQKLYDDATTR